MLPTTPNPVQYPPAGKGGPSFDHLVGAGDLLSTTIPSAFSRASDSTEGVSAASHEPGLELTAFRYQGTLPPVVGRIRIATSILVLVLLSRLWPRMKPSALWSSAAKIAASFLSTWWASNLGTSPIEYSPTGCEIRESLGHSEARW
jgi:hypothetical protein